VTNIAKNRAFFLNHSILAVVRARNNLHYFAGLNACDIYGGTWCPSSTGTVVQSYIEDRMNGLENAEAKKNNTVAYRMCLG
jgi:hypothetical protein